MYNSLVRYDDDLDAFIDVLDGYSQRTVVNDGHIDDAKHRIRRGRQIPRDLRGVSPNITHWQKVGDIYRLLHTWFPNAAVSVDKNRREYGVPASPKRPDLQFRNPERHRATHIEVDTDRKSMQRHVSNRDPSRRSVFLLIDRDSGRVIEKQVFPAGSDIPRVTNEELKRSDLFDDFDAAADLGWWQPRRWGCKLKCAWLYGEGCRERCGFDASCISRCTSDLYACNSDCDRSYP